MAQLPNTWAGALDDGDPADGAAMEGYLDAIRTSVNSIDDSQIAAGANIDAAKLIDQSIDNTKIIDDGILANEKLADDSVIDEKLDWDDDTQGIKAIQVNRVKLTMLTGSHAVVVASGTATKTESVAFATESDDYVAAFDTTTGLRILCTIFADTSPAEALVVEVDAIATTGFDIIVRTGDDGVVGADRTVAVHWIAIGRRT